jgi:hypothetical protein
MMCPCRLVQTSLINSLGSTLICPPSAAEDPGLRFPNVDPFPESLRQEPRYQAIGGR